MKSSNNERFDLLVEKGARQCTHDCPLFAAGKDHRFHMVKVLVDQKYCIYHSGWLLAESLKMQDRIIFVYLLEIGLRVDLSGDGALLVSIEKGDEEMVRFLIGKGADPHIAGFFSSERFLSPPKNHSYVYVAIVNGHTKICKMLVEEYNVRPGIEDLDLAWEKGNYEVIDLLSGFSYDDVPEKWPILEKMIDLNS